MGWWTQDEEGHSFAHAEGKEMMWGDAVADIMDEALDQIIQHYERFLNRRPTKSEIMAGLKFSTNTLDENMNELPIEALPEAKPERKDGQT